MMPSTRFELKIPVPYNRLEEINSWLSTHKYGFKDHHPDRWVNSLYLDLPNLACFEENLSGINNRKKVRIRWYNELENANNATLEFKHRRSGKGYKVCFDTSMDIASKSCSWKKTLKQSYRALPDKGKALWVSEHSPVLICRYKRKYLVSKDDNIRATFDESMHIYDQRYRDRVNINKSQSLGDYVLLELKCDDVYEKELGDLVSSCPLRPTRHSKYVNGVRYLTWV